MGKMFESCSYFVGCNYWASHAGTAMWSDWRPEVVESDFKRLSEHKVKVLRVFPLWPDFQPITLLCKYSGIPVEYRFGEEPLSDDEERKAGVSKTAIARFAEFADLAENMILSWSSGY